MNNRLRTVAFDAGRNTVVLIDQRRLPHRFTFFRAKDFHETAKAIANMTVRGAGAIGATAAYGLAQGARAFRGLRLGEFRRHVDRVHKTLRDARPTAGGSNQRHEWRAGRDGREPNRVRPTAAGTGSRGAVRR